jgi:pilus assembly protein Flp/PilA
MRNLITRFSKDESGASMVEYGLLVALIAVVCIASIQVVGTQLNAVFALIGADLTTAVGGA